MKKGQKLPPHDLLFGRGEGKSYYKHPVSSSKIEICTKTRSHYVAVGNVYVTRLKFRSE